MGMFTIIRLYTASRLQQQKLRLLLRQSNVVHRWHNANVVSPD